MKIKDLKIGDFFKYSGEIYAYSDFGGIQQKSGSTLAFHSETSIIPLKRKTVLIQDLKIGDKFFMALHWWKIISKDIEIYTTNNIGKERTIIKNTWVDIPEKETCNVGSLKNGDCFHRKEGSYREESYFILLEDPTLDRGVLIQDTKGIKTRLFCDIKVVPVNQMEFLHAPC